MVPRPNLTIYIKSVTCEKKEVYQYTFYKNIQLFRWLLKLPHFKYNRTEKLLYTEARQDILDFIEVASKGMVINKSKLYQEYVAKTQYNLLSVLARIEVPKYNFNSRLYIKTALIEGIHYYLMISNQVNNCKKALVDVEFVSYNKRLSAFLMLLQGSNLLKLLKAVKGFISPHQHVKIQSLYLRSFLWKQSYHSEVVVPEDCLKHLKSRNYSLNTIQNCYIAFFNFIYYCESLKTNIQDVSPAQVNDIFLKIASHNGHSTSTTHLMINAVLYSDRNWLLPSSYTKDITTL